MKVKVVSESRPYRDITLGETYTGVELDACSVMVIDDVGEYNWIDMIDCEFPEESFAIQDLRKGTIDFLYNDKAPDKLTFKKLQQYASELNIDITFLPENKITVYIDNTLDKTYTVETEDELKEVVEALRLVDKYLDKD